MIRRLCFTLFVLVALVSPAVVSKADSVTCNLDAPSAPATINFIGWTYPILDYYAGQVKACRSVKNITVNAQLLSSDDAHQQVRTAFAAKGDSPFDIVHGDNAFINELAAGGNLTPLNDLIAKYSDKYNLKDIDPSLFAAGSIGDKVYGIPIIVNTQHLYYNTDVLKAAGLTPPQTYDDLINDCKAMDLKKLGIDHPFAMVLSAGWAWQIEFTNLLESYGGSMLDASNKPTFNSKQGAKALGKLTDVANACMVSNKGLLLSTDDVQAGLRNGSIAMAHLWASRANGMDDPKISDAAGKIAYAPALLPESGVKIRGAIPWVDFLSIPANSKADKDLVFRIIMEATKADSQLGAAKLGLVSRKSAVSAELGNAAAALQTIAEGGPSASTPALALANAALGEFLPKVATKELTIQAALDGAAAKYTTEATAQKFIKN